MPTRPPKHKPARPTAPRHTVAEPEQPTRYGQGRGGRPWRRKRDRVLERDGWLCQCADCQRPGVLPKLAEEVDHVLSLANGGTDDDDNLRAIAGVCHKRKTAREKETAARRGTPP